MSCFERVSSILRLPSAYRLFSQAVGAKRARLTYLEQHVKPQAGEKVLDIGCGPADVLEYLSEVDYLGLDISPEYISAAKRRFGARGRFLCGDVGMATIEREQGTFHLAMATGVLHHLDDERANKLFTLARVALSPTGRLITYDGCFVPGQSSIARWMLRHDRGKFVRSREQYLKLASNHFATVSSQLRQDLLRIPYTHLIMSCSN
jgi:SAM-dependent methyltransferase